MSPGEVKMKEKRERTAEREKRRMAGEAGKRREEEDRLAKEAKKAEKKMGEAERLKKEEADRKKAEADAEKAEADAKKAEADAKKAEADAKKAEADRVKKEEADRKKVQADAKKAEEERKRKAAEEKERKRLEEEERKRNAAEEKERKRLEEEELKRLEAEAGQGLILDPKLKTELAKLKPKTEFTHEVLFHFQNQTDEPLTYYMISPDDPRANIFELPPQTSFKESFSVANPWIILRNNSTPIAAYDAYSSTLPTQEVILLTDKSKKTTSQIITQNPFTTSPIPHDPRILKKDFHLIMTEDLQESFLRDTQSHLILPANLLITDKEAFAWNKIGACKNKQVAWVGTYKAAGQQNPLNFQNLMVDFEGQVTGNGADDNGNFTVKGEMLEEGN
jgi:hypothetical protein